MAKKFYDIIPPKEISSLEDNKINNREEEKEEIIQPVLRKKSHFLRNLIFFAFVLIILSLVGFFFFSKTEVEIWPKTDILSFEETITIDLEATLIDFDNNVISGQILKDQKTISKEYSTSGRTTKQEKAKGVIRVYNSYSTSPRTLIPSRFVSSDGKLFWSTKRITIPGAKQESGRLVPGEIDVGVEAAEPGEEYNIGPTTFALPALAGTALYTTIYAKSFSSITGGFEGEVAQLSQPDLDGAEIDLSEHLKDQGRDSLKAKTSEDFILLDQAVFQEIKDIKSSEKVEAEVESFNIEAELDSKAIIFKRSDIENLIKSHLDLAIEEDKRLQNESLEINYSLKEIDFETGTMILDLSVKARVYSDIDLNQIKRAILGRPVSEAQIFLDNFSELTKSEIRSWSFLGVLKRKIPEDIDKIELKLNLD
jgi:hypothetical protein